MKLNGVTGSDLLSRHLFTLAKMAVCVVLAVLAAKGGRICWERCSGGADKGDGMPVVEACGGGGGTSYTLTLNKTGTGALEVVPPNTTPTTFPWTYSYAAETILMLTASAPSGWCFHHWEGGITGSENPVLVTMDADKSVTAVFLATYTLSTSVSPTGSGTVSPSSGTYVTGTNVSLTASAASGYRFDHWTGDATGTANPVTVTLNANKSVTAVFVQRFTLGTAVSPVNTGTVTPSSGTYDAGTNVQLTATPVAGWYFNYWDGSLTGSTNPQTLTMNANKSVTAVFGVYQYVLTAQMLGTGTVGVYVNGQLMQPPYVFDYGTTVNLVAEAGTNYRFDHWEGDAAGGNASVSLVMDGPKMARAVFVRLYTLTTGVTPSGMSPAPAITMSPEGNPPGTFLEGAQVSVSAEAHVSGGANGYDFMEWSGQGSTNPITVTMDSDKSLTAVYDAVVVFPDANLDAVVRTAIAKPTGTIHKGDLAGLGSLSLSVSQPVANLTGLEACTNLHYLSILEGTISDLSPLSGLAPLTSLWLEDCGLTNISPLGNLTGLQSLNLRSNEGILDFTALENLTSLTSLLLDSTSMNDGDFAHLSGLTGLAVLHVNDNQISSLNPVAGMMGLHWFSAYDNDIGDLSPLANLTGLSSLSLARNPLTSLAPLAGLSNLTQLDLSRCGLSNVDALAGWFPNLETLRLSDNEIGQIAGWGSWASIETLELDGNALETTEWLAGLSGLTTLLMNDNNLDDLSGLAGLANLYCVGLRSNEITDLSALVSNAGIGTGDWVWVTGNPLNGVAKCIQIPDLQARDVTVFYSGACVANGSDPDPDGDGFTTTQEQEYLMRFIQDLDVLYYTWLNWIDDDTMEPPFAPAEFDNKMECMPVEDVIVEVEGQGTVATVPALPGIGDWGSYTLASGNGDSETYEFPKYAYDCASPCATAPTCDYNSITLTATPAEGWVFDYWEGNLGANAGRWENPLHLELGGDRTVQARFLYRPTIATLDLVSDLAYFLVFIGETATVETFDRNEVEYDPDNGMSRLYVGNGMPDAAEFYLLQAILKERGLDLSARGGVVNDAVWAAWSANVTRAQTDLPGQDARIIRTVAAYMTLGDFGSAATIEDMVESHISGASVDPANYDNSQRSFLAAGEDADNDGATNLQEWQAASPGGGLANLAAFASAATDGDDGPGSSGGQGDSCPNEACLDTGEMEVRTADFFSPEASATVTATPEGSGIVLGTEMSVSVEPNASNGTGFRCWIAPDSMIDGSRARKESGWLLMDDTEAVAMIERGRLFLPDDNSNYSITVTCNGGAIETVDGEENRVVVGPPGATATLTAVSNSSLRVIGWQWEGTRFSYSDSVTLPLGGHAEPIMSSQPLTGKKSISVSASQGGTAMAAAISVDWDGCFLGSIEALQTSKVSFLANPSPGWEFDYWEGYPGLGPLLHNWNASGVSSMRAVFRRKVEHTLSLELEGDDAPCSGYITVDDPKKYYSQDEEVTLTANPAPGYVFLFWDGLSPCSDDPPANSNPLYLTMHRSRSVTAVFDLDPVILMQGSRRILETAGDVDEDGIQDNVATISAAPAMPQLRARIRNCPSGVLPSWQLRVTFQRNLYGQQGVQTETAWYPATPVQVAEFAPTFTDPAFIGGDATVLVTWCSMSYEFDFRILGANPSFTSITNNLENDAFRALCWAESTYRQFEGPHGRPQGGTIGLPLPNGGHDGGYGLMQITNPVPSIEDLWCWTTNTDSGKHYFTDVKAADSDRKVAWWNDNLSPTPAPPLALTGNNRLLDIFCRYNGGYYWTPQRRVDDDGNFIGSEYIWVLNSDNPGGIAYADHVMDIMNDRPWLGPWS